VGDVALFLPTRNSSGKPWAAFNINAPHYFLKPTEYVLSQMTKEWIVARIVSITEHVTDANIPESNPYGLANNLTYYQLTVENWKNHRNGSSKRRSKEQGISSSVSIAEPVVVGMNRKNSYTAASGVKLDSGLASITSPSTSPPETVTTPAAALSQKRPGYPLSISSSNIVHSYANSSSSNPFSEDERRRRSIDMIKTKE
jgi:predicted nucleic acid-binding protein